MLLDLDPSRPCNAVLLDISVYKYIERVFGLVGKTNNEYLVETIVDRLNEMVKEGKIIKDGAIWVMK